MAQKLCPRCGNALDVLEDGNYACYICKKKYNLKKSTNTAPATTNTQTNTAPTKAVTKIVVNTERVTLFVCPSCGSPNHTDLGNKIRCNCCTNVYERDKQPPFSAILTQAENLRQIGDFEGAKALYEKIIKDYPENDLSPAYFGLFICENNVFFETDGRGEIFPSFYRVSNQSVDNNENFQQAIFLSNSFSPDKVEKMKDLGEKIEYARKMYWDIKNDEDPFDVFICFRNDHAESTDCANEIYNTFASKYHIFYSEKTLKHIRSLHRNYEPNIYYGLYTAKVMLLICKDRKQLEGEDGKWVKNEWSRFSALNRRGNMEKAIIPIFVDDFNPNDLPDELWHIQGMRYDASLMLNLDIQLQKYINPIDKEAELAKKLAENEAKRDAEMQKMLAELERKQAEERKKLMESINVGGGGVGGPSVSSMLRLMWTEIRDTGNFEKARKIADDILKIAPENSEAWWGLTFVQFGTSKEEELINNLRYYETATYKLAYKHASTEEKEKYDNVRNLYEEKNKDCALELYKSDLESLDQRFESFNNTNKVEDLDTFNFMASLYTEYSNLIQKIRHSTDPEYVKYLDDTVKHVEKQQNSLLDVIASKFLKSIGDRKDDDTQAILWFKKHLELLDTFPNLLSIKINETIGTEIAVELRGYFLTHDDLAPLNYFISCINTYNALSKHIKSIFDAEHSSECFQHVKDYCANRRREFEKVVDKITNTIQTCEGNAREISYALDNRDGYQSNHSVAEDKHDRCLHFTWAVLIILYLVMAVGNVFHIIHEETGNIFFACITAALTFAPFLVLIIAGILEFFGKYFPLWLIPVLIILSVISAFLSYFYEGHIPGLATACYLLTLSIVFICSLLFETLHINKIEKKLNKKADNFREKTFINHKEYFEYIKNHNDFDAFKLNIASNPIDLQSLSDIFCEYINALDKIKSLYENDIRQTDDVQSLIIKQSD